MKANPSLFTFEHITQGGNHRAAIQDQLHIIAPAAGDTGGTWESINPSDAHVIITEEDGWYKISFKNGKKGFYRITVTIPPTTTRAKREYSALLLVGDVPIPNAALVVVPKSFNDSIGNPVVKDNGATFNTSTLETGKTSSLYRNIRDVKAVVLSGGNAADVQGKDFNVKAVWNRNRFPFEAPTPKGTITYSSSDANNDVITIDPNTGTVTTANTRKIDEDVKIRASVAKLSPYDAENENNMLLYMFGWDD